MTQTICRWLVALLVFVGLAGAWAPARATGASAVDHDLYAAVLPQLRPEIAAETAGALSVYRIEATLELAESTAADDGKGHAAATLTGDLDLRVVNPTGGSLTELPLRLYANDPRYGIGDTSLRGVAVDGVAVEPVYGVGHTLARVGLPHPLPAGGTAELTLAFTTTVREAPGAFFSGLLNVDSGVGTVALAHWYPILAGYDPAAGWLLDPVSEFGDEVFSDAALYDVALTAPTDLVVVTSGVSTASDASGDRTRYEFVTGPVREFTLLADDDFTTTRVAAGGAAVTVYANPGQTPGARAVAEVAAASLTLFNDSFGPYPYAELDLVEWPLYGPGGMEFPGLIGLDSSLFATPAAQAEQGLPPGLAEFVVAHEVAHQWWYGLVGNNQYAHAFLDEALSEYTTILYVEHAHGAAAAAQQMDLLIRLPYAYQRAAGGDLAVDQSTAAFPSYGAYSSIVYAKGALGFEALRTEIGDEAFLLGLRDYAARWRFQVAAPADLRAAFERAAGRDLDGFWHACFEATETTPAPTAVGTPSA